MMRAASTLGLALLASATLGACGEKPQTAAAKKPDARAHEGTSTAYQAPGWKAGDATSWEAQVRKRTEGQNEYAKAAPASK